MAYAASGRVGTVLLPLELETRPCLAYLPCLTRRLIVARAWGSVALLAGTGMAEVLASPWLVALVAGNSR